MERAERYLCNSEVSEKAIESYLAKRMRELGGLALKYANPNANGYPDRLLLFPSGKAAWVEVKSKGKKMTALQAVRRSRLNKLGFYTFTIDSKEKVDKVLKELETLFNRADGNVGKQAAITRAKNRKNNKDGKA